MVIFDVANRSQSNGRSDCCDGPEVWSESDKIGRVLLARGAHPNPRSVVLDLQHLQASIFQTDFDASATRIKRILDEFFNRIRRSMDNLQQRTTRTTANMCYQQTEGHI